VFLALYDGGGLCMNGGSIRSDCCHDDPTSWRYTADTSPLTQPLDVWLTNITQQLTYKTKR